MGGTYHQEGDYLIPNLALPDEPEYQIGKYGRMRRSYLKEHRPVLYANLLTSGTLHRHLAEIDQACNERMEIIVSDMAKQETVGLTAFPIFQTSSSGNPCATSRLSSLPMRWAMKLSGRNEDKGDAHMTDTEKKLLQAQHRLEEAQARDRAKERKARTRRLIQEGAILEKVLPEVRTMELSALEDYLMQKLLQHD